MTIWEAFTIDDDAVHTRRCGPLNIWIRRLNDEWLVASGRGSDGTGLTHAAEPPEDVEWFRYVISGDSTTVKLSPAPPDRSVVVRPESILTIESGAQALFFVLLPVWVHLSVGIRKKHFLGEIPGKILSNTWFGEPHEGELCYFLKTWAKRSLEGLEPRPHQAVCPVVIKNGSSADLVFNRICIRTGYLSIYQGTSWLWTNKIEVQFRGVNQTSRLKYDHEVPSYESGCRLMNPARQKPPREFSLKSFDTFKTSYIG